MKDFQNLEEYIQDHAVEQQPNRVLKVLIKHIIPQLLKQINMPSLITTAVKAEQREERYKQDRQNVLKLPIALALIKLLQKFPKTVLNHYFGNIIYKVSNFLKSKSKAVRIISRDILRKILVSLGPSYLEEILNHVSSTLCKGNEVHILTVTVNGLIEAVKPLLKAEHLNSILQLILKVSLTDIFRANSGYKKEMQILNRRNEVKPSKKSYLTLEIAASGISEACIIDLVMPIKDTLMKTHSKVELAKVQECLDRIVIGLCKNENLSKEALLIFVYGILNDNIPQLALSEGERNERIQRKKTSLKTLDTFIIPAAPKRKGALTHSTVRWKVDTNVYMLTQFAFQILHNLLKRKQVFNAQCKPCIDELIPLVSKSLQTEEVKIKMYALKSMACIWNSGLKLKNLPANEPEVVRHIFETIEKSIQYNLVRKEENLQLIRNTFKALVSFFRNVNKSRVSLKQTELLLEYVHTELNNEETKTMAFSLLKAIIDKKLKSKLISRVMTKLSHLSAYSQSAWIR